MVIERAMSISIEDRFATVEEFWHELTNPAPKQQAQPPPPQSLNITEGELAQTPRPQSIDTPLPLTIPEQDLERITTIAAEPLQQQPPAPRSRKRGVLLAISLALLFIVAVGTGLLLFVPRHGSPPTTQSVTRTLTSTPQARATATPRPTPVGPVYPTISASYAGTILDLLSYQKTSLFLTSIQHNGGNISGYFQGLGLNGPFKGTVTTHGHLDFTVSVNWTGVSTLEFKGDIKIGGNIAGTFAALNQQGQPTGEGGPWYAA